MGGDGEAKPRRPPPVEKTRRRMGTAVFFGMIGVTAFGLVFTPTFYVVSRKAAATFAEWRSGRGGAAALQPAE